MTSMNKLIDGLKQVKKQGGQWFDFIENENDLINENYELAMIALNWDARFHSEKQFDEQMEALFDSL